MRRNALFDQTRGIDKVPLKILTAPLTVELIRETLYLLSVTEIKVLRDILKMFGPRVLLPVQ